MTDHSEIYNLMFFSNYDVEMKKSRIGDKEMKKMVKKSLIWMPFSIDNQWWHSIWKDAIFIRNRWRWRGKNELSDDLAYSKQTQRIPEVPYKFLNALNSLWPLLFCREIPSMTSLSLHFLPTYPFHSIPLLHVYIILVSPCFCLSSLFSLHSLHFPCSLPSRCLKYSEFYAWGDETFTKYMRKRWKESKSPEAKWKREMKRNEQMIEWEKKRKRDFRWRSWIIIRVKQTNCPCEGGGRE